MTMISKRFTVLVAICCVLCCVFFISALLAISFIFGVVGQMMDRIGAACSEIDFQIEKQCKPKMEVLKNVTNRVIPSFDGSQEMIDAAQICEETLSCYQPINCVVLRLHTQMHKSCELFRFFSTRFENCREKLKSKAKLENIGCINEFFTSDSDDGKVDDIDKCPAIEFHQNCVEKYIEEECGSKLRDSFKMNIHNYKDVMNCPKKISKGLA